MYRVYQAKPLPYGWNDAWVCGVTVADMHGLPDNLALELTLSAINGDTGIELIQVDLVHVVDKYT